MVALTWEQQKAAQKLACRCRDDRDLSAFPPELRQEVLDYIEWLEDSANVSTDRMLMKRIFANELKQKANSLLFAE